MKEICEFRILKETASLLFEIDECKNVSSSVVKCELNSDDPRFDKIWDMDRQYLFKTGKPFFYSWHLRRIYTEKELKEAQFFRAIFTSRSYFEPAGIDCGTIYDETSACSLCGIGAKQVSPLRLRANSIPKSVDCAVTIAEIERLFSSRLLAALRSEKITGIRSQKIQTTSKGKTQTPAIIPWEQIFSDGPHIQFSSRTITGNRPQDHDEKNEHRCACGNWCGLNILSELHVNESELPKTDFAMTICHFGGHRGVGVVHQSQEIIVSQKFRKAFELGGFKGLRFEIVRIV